MQRDFIESFMDYTDGIPSPKIFRLWAAITCISGALERRVWLSTRGGFLFPNLFTLLVSAPGIGKDQSITPVFEIWSSVKSAINGKSAFHVAPKSVTKASLLDELEEATQKLMVKDELVEYNSLLVCAPEFGVFISAHDLEFLSVLNDIYNNPPNFRESRRTLSKKLDIANPQIIILGGSQPSFLASLLPEEAWSMGFTSRLIMIHSAVSPQVDMLRLISAEEAAIRERLRLDLVRDVQAMTGLYGEASMTEEARDFLTSWQKSGAKPAPKHSKLQHYISRRFIHVLKLSMIAAVSRSATQQIELCDAQRALDWLLEAEQSMPDIFREMSSRSDMQVIEEMHFFMWKTFHSEGKKGIHISRISNFLQTKVPVEKVPKIISAAEMSDWIARIAGSDSMYSPRPRPENGAE